MVVEPIHQKVKKKHKDPTLRAPRGFGDLGRMAIYFQGAWEHRWLFSGIWGASS